MCATDKHGTTNWQMKNIQQKNCKNNNVTIFQGLIATVTFYTIELYQMQMPADFGIGLCVWVCGPIFQVRLNFSADDRGTKDYREEEEEGGDRLSEMCQNDKKKKRQHN